MIIFILLIAFICAPGLLIFNMAQSSVVSTDTLQMAEIQAFNEQFEVYEGSAVTGTNVKTLLTTCVTNASINSNSEERLPDIEYVDLNYESSQESIEIDSDIQNTAVNEINSLKSKISNAHYYIVEMEYNDEGLVDNIIITY